MSVRILYSDEKHLDDKPDASIFLAGPTPRGANTKSWRPEAVELFNRHMKVWSAEYPAVTLYVPERRNWDAPFDYKAQCEWEWFGLNNCDVIMFWVPRNTLNGMPAFTTNVEFGTYLARRPNCCVYGRPDDAEHTRYLDWLYERTMMAKVNNTLEDTVIDSLCRLHVNKKYYKDLNSGNYWKKFAYPDAGPAETPSVMEILLEMGIDLEKNKDDHAVQSDIRNAGRSEEVPGNPDTLSEKE